MRDKGCVARVTLDAPDPGITIQIYSNKGLKCVPNVLDFSLSQTASFRITGNVIGPKSLSMIKFGENSRDYQASRLPFGKLIIVEPPFMKFVF